LSFAVGDLNKYPVRKVCEILRIKRSTCYNWKKRIPKYEYSEEEKANVLRKHKEHHNSFGRRIIKRELDKEGIKYSESKVSKIMKELGIKSKYGRKKGKNVYTSEETEEKYIKENIFNLSNNFVI